MQYNNQIKYAVKLFGVHSNRLYCGFCENCGKLVFSDIPHQSVRFCKFCIYKEMDNCGQIVYLLRSPATKLLKIGTTGNIEQRVTDLSNAQGVAIEVVSVIPGGYKLESALHKMFSVYRAKGEWFIPCHKIISTFKELVETNEKTSYIDQEEVFKVVEDYQDKKTPLIKKGVPLMYQIEELEEFGISSNK
jgi:hypothetical protein